MTELVNIMRAPAAIGQYHGIVHERIERSNAESRVEALNRNGDIWTYWVENYHAGKAEEPEFIAQRYGFDDNAEVQKWINKQCDAMRESEATWFRATIHPDDDQLVLLEGWKMRPKDQGEPRFQFQATEEVT